MTNDYRTKTLIPSDATMSEVIAAFKRYEGAVASEDAALNDILVTECQALNRTKEGATNCYGRPSYPTLDSRGAAWFYLRSQDAIEAYFASSGKFSVGEEVSPRTADALGLVWQPTSEKWGLNELQPIKRSHIDNILWSREVAPLRANLFKLGDDGQIAQTWKIVARSDGHSRADGSFTLKRVS